MATSNDAEDMAVSGRVSRMQRVSCLLIGTVLTAAGVFCIQSPASGASTLSSVVLSQSLPGLVPAPPGVRNGPINESNLSLVTGGTSGPAETEFPNCWQAATSVATSVPGCINRRMVTRS